MNDKTDEGEINLYWFRLIDTLIRSRLIDIGPTIPYLIGAKRHKDKISSPASDSIANLILDIVNSDEEYVGVIQYCDRIENVVIGIIHRDSIGDKYETAIKVNNEQGRISLICTLDEGIYGSGIDEVKNSLVATFSHPVNSKRYSWDYFNTEWVAIPPNDLEIIEQVA
jgi:hypothetical protein